AGQTEETLFENGVAPVPQGQRETQTALPVRDAEQFILAPVVRSAARVVMGEIVPRIAPRRIILAHRGPLPFSKVGTPTSPVLFTTRGFVETQFLFGFHGRCLVVRPGNSLHTRKEFPANRLPECRRRWTRPSRTNRYRSWTQCRRPESRC